MAMRKQWNFQTAVQFAVCIIVTAILLPGCAAFPGDSPKDGGLMRFTGGNAAYTAEFAADSGEPLVGTCERNGTSTVLRITSPERLAGFTVTYDASAGCTAVAVGEMSLYLSPEVAAGVTDVFDLLSRTDGGTVAKSPDGAQTVVTYENGTVTVSSDGVPVEVTVGERVVKIGSFEIR